MYVVSLSLPFLLILSVIDGNNKQASLFVDSYCEIRQSYQRHHYHQSSSILQKKLRQPHLTKQQQVLVGKTTTANQLVSTLLSNKKGIIIIMKRCLPADQSSLALFSANNNDINENDSSIKIQSQENEQQEQIYVQPQKYIISGSSASNNMFVSFLNMIGSTTSIIVAGIFFIALSYQRNAFMISFFIGAIMNAILSKVLKRFINQTRPQQSSPPQITIPATTTDTTNSPPTSLIDQLRKPVNPSDNGMPSSHAMSLGFIGTFVICHTVVSLSSSLTMIAVPIIILYCIISLWYRIHIQLHTFEQILVGSIIGTMNGYIWYQLCVYRNIIGCIIMNPISTTSTPIGIIEIMNQYGTLYSFFNSNGQCSITWLLVPALIGAATVGSVERRIAFLIPSSSSKNKNKDKKES